MEAALKELADGVDLEEFDDFDPMWESLLPALSRLDERLTAAIAAAKAALGPEAGTDPFRGLHITPEDVQQLLARSPCAPYPENIRAEVVAPLTSALAPDSRLGWLQQAFDLSVFDLDLLIISLAPELDLRYERLYAFLQDDVSRRRAGIDLALNLLCATAAEKIARRAHLAADAPLITHGLLHLLPDPQLERAPLLAHSLRLDPQILRLLLGEDRLDERLADFCTMIEPDVEPVEVRIPGLDTADGEALTASLRDARASESILRIYFQGEPGIGKRTTAETLASEIGASLLRVDLNRLPEDGRGCTEPLRVLFREAWFQDALLYLDDLDALRVPERSATLDGLMRELAAAQGIVLLAGTAPWPKTGRRPVGVHPIIFRMPDTAQRRLLWRVQLDTHGISPDESDLGVLSERFRLTPAQIADAVANVAIHSIRRTDGETGRDDAPMLPKERLFAVARAQCGQDLAGLAANLTPVYGWDDIVLPEDTMAQLHELCQRVRLRERVMNDWGFGRKLSQGKGVSALFAGPSGTGKTMAAEVIANALGLDLYRIDLAGVVSKYIGETEKNLNRIFRAAEDANAILLFDEADALFGKRSKVRDSHDRYANIEISYLLQKMEQYEGVAILATNLKQNLDEAFVRRLAFIVHFPEPDVGNRREIWKKVWPNEMPLSDDLDFDRLAAEFKLSGGNIKNVAVGASFSAAEVGHSLRMTELRQALRREYQKQGKTLSEAELLGTSADVLPLGSASGARRTG